MRLTRSPAQPERDTSLLVGVVPPPALSVGLEVEQLFLQAYERLHGRLLNHAERFLGREDAKDALGDAMEALWRRWSSLTPAQRSDKWIFGVLHRCIRAKLRKEKGLVSFDEVESELDAIAMNAVPDLGHVDSAADVLDAVLTAMPPRRREVFLLVREHDLSYAEAAETLGLSLGTINTHMRLANDTVRAAFTQRGFRLTDFKPARLSAPKGDDQ